MGRMRLAQAVTKVAAGALKPAKSSLSPLSLELSPHQLKPLKAARDPLKAASSSAPSAPHHADALTASSAVISVTDNNWSTLHTTSPQLLEAVHKALTVPRKVYSAFKKGGYRAAPSVAAFITKKGRFGTGLLPVVIQQLQALQAKYTINDKRVPLPELFAKKTGGDPQVSLYKQISESDTLFGDVGVTLRDYQIKAANEALKHHRGIIKCATGGGKTWILAAILKVLGEGVPTVIIVNQRVLAEQLHTTLKKAGIKNVGMFMGGIEEPNTITICTIQTLHRSEAKKTLLQHAKVLMVDEVHEYTTKISRDTFCDFSQAFVRLGFSATPFKHVEHKHILMSSFGPALVDVSIEELVNKNVITNSIVNFYPINYPEIHAPNWSVAESQGIVHNQYFHQCVVALVNSIPSGRIMVLVQRIAHGDALHRLLPGSFWISGKDESDARAEVLEKLRTSTSEKVVALVSSIGFVGVDVFVHHLINAAGGREQYLTIQKIGRGLRKASDKDILHYHDFTFSFGMNRMLCSQSAARIRTLTQNGYTVTRQRALLPPPAASPTLRKL